MSFYTPYCMNSNFNKIEELFLMLILLRREKRERSNSDVNTGHILWCPGIFLLDTFQVWRAVKLSRDIFEFHTDIHCHLRRTSGTPATQAQSHECGWACHRRNISWPHSGMLLCHKKYGEKKCCVYIFFYFLFIFMLFLLFFCSFFMHCNFYHVIK